jgi:signal transduction histidine kinase
MLSGSRPRGELTLIQIRRVLFIFLLLLSCAGVLFFGIRDYLLIARSVSLSQGELKIRGETVLYLSIVFSAAILFAFSIVLLRSRNISRELDKISDMTRYGNFSIEGSLGRIGPLGDKILQLNQRLTELNAMKSLRISSLASINAFLLNNSRLALLVTDITGKITNVSARCLEKLKKETGEVVGRHITDVLPELDFQSSVATIEKQRGELELSDLKESPTLYPVQNSRNELSNIIFVLGKEEIVTKISKYAEERSKPISQVTKLVRKYFRGRPRGRGE